MSSITFANNFCFIDSCYAILTVRKQDATCNLLLSIKQDDQGDWDNQGDYGDWKDWDYKAWMTEIIKTTKDDKGS